MTLDELKEEADKLGYIVVKKNHPVGRMKHCTCGRYPNVHRNHFRHCEFWVFCPGCGKKGPSVRWEQFETRNEVEFRARRAWDDMIVREENDED